MCATMKKIKNFQKGMGIGGWLTNYKRFNVLPDDKRLEITVGDMEHFESYITEADVAEQYRYGRGYIVKPEQNLVYLYVTNDEYGANKTALKNMSITELADFSFATAGTQIVGGNLKRNFVIIHLY